MTAENGSGTAAASANSDRHVGIGGEILSMLLAARNDRRSDALASAKQHAHQVLGKAFGNRLAVSVFISVFISVCRTGGSVEEGEEPSQLFFARLPPVFAELECLGVSDSFPLPSAVPADQGVAVLFRDQGVERRDHPGPQPLAAAFQPQRDFGQHPIVPGQPFVDLRRVPMEHIELLFDALVDRKNEGDRASLKMAETNDGEKPMAPCGSTPPCGSIP